MNRKILLAGVAAAALAGATWSSVAMAGEVAVGWASSTTTDFKYLTNATPGVSGIGTDHASWSQTVATASGVSVTTVGRGQASPFLGVPSVQFSNTQDIAISCPAGATSCTGSLALIVTAYDMTYPAAGMTNWQVSFSVPATDTGLVSDTEQVFVDDSDGGANPAYPNASSIPTADSIAGPTTTSETITTSENLTDPYSITELYLISFALTPGNSLNINDTISVNAVVPEPASLSLLGGGLVAFGAWRRRRSKTQARAS